MITRKASASHICLRCQRRLANPSSSYRYRLAFQSTNTGTDPSSAPESPSTSEPPGNGEHTTAPSSRRRRSQVHQKLVPLPLYKHGRGPASSEGVKRYKVVQEDRSDFYGHSGQQKVGNREQVEINTLGKSTNVIVLRESKITRYDGTIYTPPAQQAEQVDIIARLDEERGLTSQTEIEQNINEFRPEHGQEPKTRAEFNKLVDKIQAAFTSSQIERYMGTFEGKRTLQAAPESGPALPLSAHDGASSISYKGLILKETPWIGETTHSTGYLEEKLSLRGYVLASHTNKHRLVVQLLRECWMLELPNVVVSLGHVDLLLRRGDVQLLSSSSVLDDIRDNILLQDDETIEIFPESNIVRVTATRPRCEFAVELIKKTLQNIARTTISITDLMPAVQGKAAKSIAQDSFARWAKWHFDDATLLELGKLTNSVVTSSVSKAGNQTAHFDITFSCLTSPKDPWRSSRNDMAQRLLLNSYPFTTFIDRAQCLVGYRDVPQSSTLTPFVPRDLPWKQKLHEWSRWSGPIGKTTSNSLGETREMALCRISHRAELVWAKKTSEQKLLSTAHSSKDDRSEPVPDDFWQPEKQQKSSALFGTILHSIPQSGEKRIPLILRGTSDTLRTFSTTLPNMTNLLKYATPKSEANVETLTIRFLPNPLARNPATKRPVGVKVLGAFPLIEMHFDIHHDQPLMLRSVEAIVQEARSDLMLPDLPIDIRFLQQSIRRLSPEKHDIPEITNFMKDSYMTKTARRLDIPPMIRFPISKSIMVGKGKALTDLGLDQDQAFHEVEYVFAERELRSSISMSVNDWDLDYTHISGGKSSGNRNELSLKPLKGSVEVTLDELHEAALDIAKSFGENIVVPLRQ